MLRWLRRARAERRVLSSRAALERATGAQDGLDPSRVTDYPGDFTGVPHIEYRPHADGLADPGEVVWAWVPYEDDPRQGKDRPVLVIGRDDDWLLGLMLTSKDHDRDAIAQARLGRHWMDVGTGAWDTQGRPSEVRLDRVLRLAPARVRREGAALSRELFQQVSTAALAVRATRRPGGAT